MNKDWLNLLFLGQQMIARSQVDDADFDLEQAIAWQDQVLTFVQGHRLLAAQQQALLSLIQQITQAAEARGIRLYHLQEELIKAHQASRKYIQSS